jgi:thiamine biosynthesis lipoprotein
MLGTFVEVSVQDTVSEKALIAITTRIFDVIAKVERAMSFHDPKSELSDINRYAHLHPVPISKEMHQVLNQALMLSELTQGRYDITMTPKLIERKILPDQGYQYSPTSTWQDIQLDEREIYFRQPLILDLGGIAKGFAVDQAVAAAQECDVIVNAGGDLKMSHWQDKTASIRLPQSPIEKQVTVPMQAASLASSGHYFQQQDVMAIIDPTGQIMPDRDVSVSVFAESCMLADALTKVVYLDNNVEGLLSDFNATAMRFDH